MTQELLIGGSTGDFYRIDSARNNDQELEKYFVLPSAKSIEIMMHDEDKLECEITKQMIENNFLSCSIHAPAYAYQDDMVSHKILNYFQNLCEILPIKNIVFHPDQVVDWTIFDYYKKLPLSIENMDDRKKSCKIVADIVKILEKYPYLGFVLDVQHCFVNDPTMQLAKEFHNVLGEKIIEYHLSGYDKKYLHYALYKTQQKEIIQAIQKPNLPIIIESTFDERRGLEKEIEYVKDFLK